MGKIGGLALVAVMALTGCASSAGAAPVAHPVRVGIYKAMSDAEFANVERGLCQHFTAGFTVDDAVHVQSELFGPEAAAEMRTVAESVRAAGC